MGIEVVVGDESKTQFNNEYSGVLVQSPDKRGIIRDYSQLNKALDSNGISRIIATDLLALTKIKTPAE